MSDQVQRLRYYDGEYLRSYDFTDEQAYHIEMRRRLNLKLHLYGIVHGLQLVKDQDSVATAEFFSISPGMAIDQTGREIYVPQPYSLSYENILKRPGLAKADFELWLCYRETQTGLPAAGYRDCNAKDQQTRWEESFQVVLKPTNLTATSFIPPDCGGVRLGTVTLDDTNGWHVKGVDNHQGRVYVGIRAQSVVAPNEVDTDDFDMTKVNVDSAVSIDKRAAPAAYVNVQPSVFERGNLIVEKNVVIGDDFELKKKGDKPDLDQPNLPDLAKIPTGNLKVTSDLFVKGEFYGFLDGKWYGLKQYIQSLMAQIKTDVQAFTVQAPAQAPNDTDVTSPFLVKFDLPSVSNVQVLLSIVEIDWQDPKSLKEQWWDKVINSQIKVGVKVDQMKPSASPNSYDLTIRWFASPAVPDPLNVGKFLLPVKGFTVNYIAIFQP